MAIIMMLLLNLNALAEVQQFSFAANKQDRVVLTYPNLEVELYSKNQKTVGIEVDAAFPVSVVKEGEELKFKAEDVEDHLAKGQQAPLVKLKITGDIAVRISSLGVGVIAEAWRSGLDVDALKGQMSFNGVSRGADLRLEQGALVWKNGSGELKFKCGSCETSIQKHRGNALIEQLSGNLNIQEVLGSQTVKAHRVKMLITECVGRLEVFAEEGILEIAKISGFAEVSTNATKISLRPGAEAQINVLDKKSKIELKNEAPLWVDLSTEEGTIAVAEPFKAQRTSFETILKGPLTAGTPRTRIVVKTQSGHISVK